MENLISVRNSTKKRIVSRKPLNSRISLTLARAHRCQYTISTLQQNGRFRLVYLRNREAISGKSS
jgi:hypothetical protein